MIQLFNRLKIGDWFHFYQSPERKLLKVGERQYLSPSGTFQSLDPGVAIFPDKLEKPQKSIFEQGDQDG